MSYDILDVRSQGAKSIAVLPCSRVDDATTVAILDADLERFADSAWDVVELDLSRVEAVSGHFMNLVLKLIRVLQKRSIRLQVRLSAPMDEIFRITRFDHLVEVLRD